jgi:2-polyprenyl-3-methyl-5-hydroxy-6-metoxy-1,4-benzoquinol methylase
MSSDKDIYDEYFFDRAAYMEGASAVRAAGILLRYFSPRSVVDIGCGTGLYLAAFAAEGVEVKGYEGSEVAIRKSPVKEKITLWNLEEYLPSDRRYDLCLSIEVAEHLRSQAADAFVRTLVGLSDTIVFTAATPGQGPVDIGHINEQPHEYWIGKFAEESFGLEREVTEEIKKEMEEAKVIWWVPKNLMVFKKIKANI